MRPSQKTSTLSPFTSELIVQTTSKAISITLITQTERLPHRYVLRHKPSWDGRAYYKDIPSAKTYLSSHQKSHSSINNAGSYFRKKWTNRIPKNCILFQKLFWLTADFFAKFSWSLEQNAYSNSKSLEQFLKENTFLSCR